MTDEIEKRGGITKLKQEGKPLIFITNENRDMVVSVAGILYDEKKDETIYAFSSLQPVNEAVQVIKEFYLYFYIGALITILLLSFVYSNMIAKPL